MIQPHGGTLINKLLPEIKRQNILEEKVKQRLRDLGYID